MINIGTLELADAYVGSTPIEKAYLGSTLVWEKSSPGPVLPYDSEIAYLYSSGSGQYIDTGVAYDSTVEIEMSVQLTGTATGNYIFGIITGISGTTYRWAVNCYSKTAVRPHFGTVTNVSANFSRGVFHTLKADYRYITIDGTRTDTKATAFNPANAKFVYLFARSNNNTADTFRAVYIGYVKMWKGGQLVRDFIPVRVDTTGYMYDKVSQTLFGNAGTGSFTLGADVT